LQARYADRSGMKRSASLRFMSRSPIKTSTSAPVESLAASLRK
jgi:hypothetical protein